MKKLLYITVNSKPEDLSSSKTVGRAFVNKFIEKYPEFTVEELDLYKAHIPRLEYQYFQKRNCIINEDALRDLPEKEQREVQKIVDLCNQFVSAEVNVIVLFSCTMQSIYSFKGEGKDKLHIGDAIT